MRLLLSVLLGYLYGSIPLGYIIGRLKGIDVTKHGFKKLGTSNVFKVLGIWYAIPTAIFDLTKGVIPFIISTKIFSIPLEYAWLSAVCAVCGHNWPLWIRFKGEGRGIATTIGILLYLFPLTTLKTILIFLIITALTRSTAPATPVFLILTPIAIWLEKQPPWALYLSVSLLVVTFTKRIMGNMEYVKMSPSKLKGLLYVIIWDRSE
ncbi:MAG: glycerol-3-phosphate acyltransferase [Candidatus Hydrothermia bacterium]